jgi:hypothetical protein
MGEQESLGSRSLRGGQCNTKSPQALAGGFFFFERHDEKEPTKVFCPVMQ